MEKFLPDTIEIDLCLFKIATRNKKQELIKNSLRWFVILLTSINLCILCIA